LLNSAHHLTSNGVNREFSALGSERAEERLVPLQPRLTYRGSRDGDRRERELQLRRQKGNLSDRVLTARTRPVGFNSWVVASYDDAGETKERPAPQ